MSTKKRIADFNRSNILTAAKQLFINNGIAPTTMDDIAKAADCSKSTIYVYFKSKDEIYHHIILEHFIMLKQGIDTALSENYDFIAGYFAVCEVLVNFHENHPLFFESILGDIKIPEDETETVLTQIYQVGEEINKIIVLYLQNGIKNGQISLKKPALQTAMTLWACLGAIITMADKKALYLGKALSISKVQFMQDGFSFLLANLVVGKEN
ncbi:MAG: TetR/AcrR family transcriptional regulator [Lachnospiraceae bacterium]|nr:TetR/AcrR family transcriptional regulator [Lachnospiraceae bacterium]